MLGKGVPEPQLKSYLFPQIAAVPLAVSFLALKMDS